MTTRRKFLQGSAAAIALASSRITLGWAPAAANATGAAQVAGKTLIVLFFRGGMDGLNWLIPRTGVNRAEYESKRPNLQVPLNKILNLNNDFGLPDAVPELHQRYQNGQLAMVHAVGMPDGLGSRSHFDSQEMFELGTPGSTSIGTGWLARHLQSTGNLPPGASVPSMATGNPPTSLSGDSQVFSIDDPGSFHPNSGRYAEEHLSFLRQLYSGSSALDLAMQTAADTVELVQSMNIEIPAFYPNTALADDLGLVAQVIKEGVGLQVATIDYGGWDTHENQGSGGTGNYFNRLAEVSQAVDAFMTDLENAGMLNDVVLVTQTDFGRRVRENGNTGTDHGTAQVMMVAGGAINGGQVYGSFPGISDTDLYLNTDLQVTTDFRLPLSDLLRNFLGNPNIDVVFPGYSGPTSMGLVPTDEIFASGFD
jgi:uncharacterized protein (DUF1501 family)